VHWLLYAAVIVRVFKITLHPAASLMGNFWGQICHWLDANSAGACCVHKRTHLPFNLSHRPLFIQLSFMILRIPTLYFSLQPVPADNWLVHWHRSSDHDFGKHCLRVWRRCWLGESNVGFGSRGGKLINY